MDDRQLTLGADEQQNGDAQTDQHRRHQVIADGDAGDQQCDCCIQDVKVIHSEDEWKEYSRDITIQGRGGTDFRPVFRYVKEQQEKKEIRRLKALIYFTDGDGIYPGSKPDYETAFVFLHKTEKMELVPPWAIRLVAEQEGVRHRP